MAGVPRRPDGRLMGVGAPRRLEMFRVSLFVSAGRKRQAPVHHQHFAEVAEHYVFRLQVAVNHPARMGKRHRVGAPSSGSRGFSGVDFCWTSFIQGVPA